MPRGISRRQSRRRPWPRQKQVDEVLELMRRAKGATLNEIMAATDWQRHSVRGFIGEAVGKKLGLKVESTRREDEEHICRIA